MERQQRQHYIERGRLCQTGRGLLIGAIERSVCSVCGDTVTPKVLEFLKGRVFVLTVENGEPESAKLHMCSYCAYHNALSRPSKCSGRFNSMGAPLDQESARQFARLMGDLKEEFLTIVVI